MHILPQLRKLEQKYRDTLAVIGVHSAKFPGEKVTANVREAVMRYGIQHPVVNDRDFRIWQSYSVRAWPTLMFLDPEGRVIGKHEGEFQFEGLDGVIGEMVAEYGAAGTLDRKRLEFQLEAATAAQRPLSFPGKIAADPGNRTLIVSDSGHNRIVIADLAGTVQQVIGSGEPGREDGPGEAASFLGPQGVAVTPDRLYVADAGNHLIRQVDRKTLKVTTIAGTGEQALFRHTGGDPLANALNSPYDIVPGPSSVRPPDEGQGRNGAGAVASGVLYIAMAGFHQLWALDLAANRIEPFAGDGREDIADGPRLQARLAQPYGVAVLGDTLYFADSETSAVRSVSLGAEGRVDTLVGTGLFDFGDQDGAGESVLLQHVQGIASGDGVIYAADTYNNRIKQIGPVSRAVTAIAGTGRAGRGDGPAAGASFNEPAGLAYLDGKLYIADTNNHLIRVVDLASKMVSTLEITGLGA
jgi:sugar lactone lactonase YvrE